MTPVPGDLEARRLLQGPGSQRAESSSFGLLWILVPIRANKTEQVKERTQLSALLVCWTPFLANCGFQNCSDSKDGIAARAWEVRGNKLGITVLSFNLILMLC